MSNSIVMPNKFDILLAYKAIGLNPRLSGCAKSVASAIIDHFNRKTGRCDPSVDRIATMLGINRATVLRATKELCCTGGPFSKDTHGGRHNTSSYKPNWAWFCGFMERWNVAMKSGENVAEMQPRTSQECDVSGRKNATQTLKKNPEKNPDKHRACVQQGNKMDRIKAPYGDPLPDRCDETAVAISPDVHHEEPNKSSLKTVQAETKKVAAKQGAEPNRQRFLVHAIDGGKSHPKSEQAVEAASRRANRYFARDPQLWGLPNSCELYAEIETAERRRKGDGLRIVSDALQLIRAFPSAVAASSSHGFGAERLARRAP